MSAQPVDPDDLGDLPDDLTKGAATPVRRTPAQARAAAKREAKARERRELAENAKRLAQIVNLHIGGYSLSAIAASTGSTVEEIEQMLAADATRYIRSQPALRTYVRNWVSEKYMKMIEADYPTAIDPNHDQKLEHQDRVMRMLKDISKLHGAEAPTQTEVKVESAPETVDALVAKIAAAQGMGYDTSIFDTVPGEVITEVAETAHEAVEVSGNALEQRQDGDPDAGF